MLEEMELVDAVDEQKEQGAEAKDGENIGEENNVRVFGDGENGGDTVHRKKDVWKFDDQ